MTKVSSWSSSHEGWHSSMGDRYLPLSHAQKPSNIVPGTLIY